MAASIIPAYRIDSVPGTRVDYAMCVNPDYDAQPGVRNAIQDLRRNSREASVNHTGFAPLRNRLASVSIETKRYGGHERKAEFQLGIWQSAQWKLLSEKAGPDVPGLLPFIPGIVVQGYEWKLVATTYKGGKTVRDSLAFRSVSWSLIVVVEALDKSIVRKYADCLGDFPDCGWGHAIEDVVN
ncbi:hypothetical protein AUP68_06458 [Ilyonectria robusta]